MLTIQVRLFYENYVKYHIYTIQVRSLYGSYVKQPVFQVINRWQVVRFEDRWDYVAPLVCSANSFGGNSQKECEHSPPPVSPSQIRNSKESVLLYLNDVLNSNIEDKINKDVTRQINNSLLLLQQNVTVVFLVIRLLESSTSCSQKLTGK